MLKPLRCIFLNLEEKLAFNEYFFAVEKSQVIFGLVKVIVI